MKFAASPFLPGVFSSEHTLEASWGLWEEGLSPLPVPPSVAESEPEGIDCELCRIPMPVLPWVRSSTPSRSPIASLCLPARIKSPLPSIAGTGCHGNGDNRHPQGPQSVHTWSLARWWWRRGRGGADVGGVWRSACPNGPVNRHREGESCQQPLTSLPQLWA